MVWPTGWKMIVMILKPEFLKRGHFTDRIHVSQRCDYSKYNNNIQTFNLQLFRNLFTIYQFCIGTSYSNVAWFNMIYNIYSKVRIFSNVCSENWLIVIENIKNFSIWRWGTAPSPNPTPRRTEESILWPDHFSTPCAASGHQFFGGHQFTI